MWIHEHQNGPKFTWNAEALAYKLANIHHNQGRLLGQMEGLGFDLRREASLVILTNDVLKSSAIEGENLNPEEVRSSIARRLGMEIAGLVPASRNVEGIVEMMLDATQQFAKPLTKDRLFDWHAALFPTGRIGMHKITIGNWQTLEVGSMRVFMSWFNNVHDIDHILKAGISHLWFVTIHPFEDGNGRIARAIGDMVLARADGIPDRFYSLSSQIDSERKDYYNQLEKQQRGIPEITEWLEWFLDCLGRAISGAHASATLYTLLICAMENNLKVENYLEDVFT